VLRYMFIFTCLCLLTVGCADNMSTLFIGLDSSRIAPITSLQASHDSSLDLKKTSEVEIASENKRDGKAQKTSKCLLQQWKHSHEEDTKGVTVYRPVNYSFPRSRGRVGFNLMAGGKLIYYGIGRTDRSSQSSGHWSFLERPNRLKMSLENVPDRPFELEIISCNEEMLKVKQ
jgi:hypothetical protein